MKLAFCFRRLSVLVATLLLAAQAHALSALDDDSLSTVVGRDGLSFAVHLDMNDPNNPNATVISRLTVGFNVNGQTNYAVMLNPHGIIDMFAVSLDVVGRPDGGDAIAIGLPGYVNFQQFGFDALGIQSDPNAPISGDLGRLVLNGQLSFQGQLRVWSK